MSTPTPQNPFKSFISLVSRKKVLIALVLFIVTIATTLIVWFSTTRVTADSDLVTPNLDPYLVSGDLAGGEAAMQSRLKAKSDDDKARFSLGILQTTRAIERMMQSLYRYGLLESPLGNGIPFLRLPATGNPNPELLTYENMQQMLRDWVADFEKVRATLQPIKDKNIKLPISIGLAHLDFNGDGKITAEESLWKVYAAATNSRVEEKEAKQFLIAFDTADALWLQGYSHVLAAMGDFLLAYDRLEIFQTCAHLFFAKVDTPHKFLVSGRNPNGDFFSTNGGFLDAIAAIHLLRFPVAEASRMNKVLEHAQAMLSLSRQSWQLIMAETDNDHEWLPNPKQKGVIPGVEITQEMIDGWLGFLDEADTLLAGKKLVPFWRISSVSSTPSDGIGINLRRVFTEPRTMDLVLWIQGTAATNYLEKGKLTDFQVWSRLGRVFGGDLFGFTVWFN
jgi:hypothetical protein